MKIISYNVNGIRAAISKGLLDWLKAADPDVLLIQEIKAMKEQVDPDILKASGYHSYFHSAEKRGYSGVAIFSKEKPDQVVYGSGIDYADREGRVIRADFGDVSVMSVYVPKGEVGSPRLDFKMNFLSDFKEKIRDLLQQRPKLVIGGDYNICHRELDIHDPVRLATVSGFLPEEREWVSSFLDEGFLDSFRVFNQEPNNYSWWSYRGNARANNKGWRLDYNMVSSDLSDQLTRAAILPEAKHSDHCPVLVEIA
jgi:exodeoxyribonuclease-3